jgi:hypothetical protein
MCACVLCAAWKLYLGLGVSCVHVVKGSGALWLSV